MVCNFTLTMWLLHGIYQMYLLCAVPVWRGTIDCVISYVKMSGKYVPNFCCFRGQYNLYIKCSVVKMSQPKMLFSSRPYLAGKPLTGLQNKLSITDNVSYIID